MEVLSGRVPLPLPLGRCKQNAPRQQRSSMLSVLCSSNGALPNNSLVNNNLPSKNPKSTVDRLESILYPDRTVAVEKIETPAGVPLIGLSIQNKPRCNQCETKGVVLCATCAGSGLYIDSILESQGIIVKVKCLGCGGSGSTLCFNCGGRGHI